MISQITPTQLEELLEIIDAYVLKFISGRITTKYLTKNDKSTLQKFGIEYGKTFTPTVEQAYRFGILSQALGDKRANQLDYNQFKKFLKSKEFLPLDMREQAVVDRMELQAYNEIKGLGNKIKQGFTGIMIEADKKQREHYEEIIHDNAKKAAQNRLSVKQLASEIGHKTKDWARDLDRISDFILHEAHDYGRAEQVIKQYGKDAKVYKRVFDHACNHCVNLYLTAGANSEPIVFPVMDLIANGTNIGRKVADWKPVIGATHPWCRCQIEHCPEGAVWDDKLQKFVVQYQSERAKQIGDKIRRTGAIKINRS